MNSRNTARGFSQGGRSRAPSDRRTEGLVAAYIHELSRRHRAERESQRTRPDMVEARA